jgi:hypothetical protein
MNKHLSDHSYSLFPHEKNQQWIIAEQDYPDAQSLVVLFDDREVKVTESKSLEGIFIVAYSTCATLRLAGQRAIASRFPSRWPGTVYVYTKSALSKSQDSANRVRVSTKSVAPDGLRWSNTLHLNKLPLETKVKIITGRIKWLFVMQNDSRSSTNSSQMTG